jgi:hypothetical protein
LSQLTAQRGLLPKVCAQTPVQKVSLELRFDLWFSTSRSVDGLWIGATEGKPWPCLDRVEGALHLIRDCDPLNYSRVLKYLDRIWVRLIPSAQAHYERQLNACVFDERFVLSETAEEIASTIIHEATHARLERWGITYDEKIRRRIEAICIRRQLDFVSKLSGGEKLREDLSAALNWCFEDHDYFSAARFSERNDQGNIELLRHLGMPNWFVWMATKLVERRLSRRDRGSLS